MAITDLDRKEIEETAIFLEKRGYIKTGDSYSVKYTLNNICIKLISMDGLKSLRKAGIFSSKGLAKGTEHAKESL